MIARTGYPARTASRRRPMPTRRSRGTRAAHAGDRSGGRARRARHAAPGGGHEPRRSGHGRGSPLESNMGWVLRPEGADRARAAAPRSRRASTVGICAAVVGVVLEGKACCAADSRLDGDRGEIGAPRSGGPGGLASPGPSSRRWPRPAAGRRARPSKAAPRPGARSAASARPTPLACAALRRRGGSGAGRAAPRRSTLRTNGARSPAAFGRHPSAPRALSRSPRRTADARTSTAPTAFVTSGARPDRAGAERDSNQPAMSRRRAGPGEATARSRSASRITRSDAPATSSTWSCRRTPTIVSPATRRLVESVKAASDIYAPVSAIGAVNDALDEAPRWRERLRRRRFFRLPPDDHGEVDELLDAEGYGRSRRARDDHRASARRALAETRARAPRRGRMRTIGLIHRSDRTGSRPVTRGARARERASTDADAP